MGRMQIRTYFVHINFLGETCNSEAIDAYSKTISGALLISVQKSNVEIPRPDQTKMKTTSEWMFCISWVNENIDRYSRS